MVNILRVAADVRLGCNASPRSPCDTDVELVKAAFAVS